jgi:hypothetical protein
MHTDFQVFIALEAVPCLLAGPTGKVDGTGTAKYKIEFLFGGEMPNGGTKHETIFSETQSPIFIGGIAIFWRSDDGLRGTSSCNLTTDSA